LLLFSGIISLSCSGPSKAEEIKAMEDYCRDYNNVCKVNSLHVIKRQTLPYPEASHYMFEYEAELECLNVNYTGGYQIPNAPVLCGQVGEIKYVKGVLELRWTENGWKRMDYAH
jgi:hypothetical protein